MLDAIESRLPDSHLETLWRKVTGKKPTKKAEREAKGRKKLAGNEKAVKASVHETSESYQGFCGKQELSGRKSKSFRRTPTKGDGRRYILGRRSFSASRTSCWLVDLRSSASIPFSGTYE